MNNEIEIFNNEEFGQVRVTMVDNEPWFVGKDVAQALGYKDTDQTVRAHVDKEDKLTRDFDGSGQKRKMTIINESGMYSLVLSSKLPSAKKFKRWVTHEILPSIRKTGTYSVQKPMDSYLIEDPIERAKAWIKEQEKLIETKKELAVAKPLAEETQKFIDHGHLIGFRELARELNVKETKLNELLQKYNWKYRLPKKTLKYHKWPVTKGYMETKDYLNTDNGHSGTSDKFTVKGRMEIEKIIEQERAAGGDI